MSEWIDERCKYLRILCAFGHCMAHSDIGCPNGVVGCPNGVVYMECFVRYVNFIIFHYAKIWKFKAGISMFFAQGV